MKALFVLAVLCGLALALTPDEEQWANFKGQFGKVYADQDQEAYRFGIFVENLRYAEKLTSAQTTAVFGVTKFMDLTPKEFRNLYLNLDLASVQRWHNRLPKASVGASGNVNWLTTANPKKVKAVSSVKDQAQCGSCWAFSAAAALEGCAMIKNGGTNVDVSAQQIVDCCHDGGSAGCNGGWPDQCLNWAVKQNIFTWASYPYTARAGTCKTTGTVAVPANTCQYYAVTRGSEPATQSALSNAPLSVCLDATPLQFYSSGIISTCTYASINHAVEMVSWLGTTYTIKNSWGTSWGEKGLFRLIADKNCLQVASISSYALPK